MATGLIATVGGFVTGVALNYAIWRGSPSLSNLAIWRTTPKQPADPSPVRGASLLALVGVLLVGGLLLVSGVQEVAGISTVVVILAVAVVSFGIVAAIDYRADRTRTAAFYLVAAVLWLTMLAGLVFDPVTAAGQGVITGITFAVLGYFLMDVLDVGLPDRGEKE